MNNSITIILWFVFLLLSFCFSGMEIAFVSSDRLRYALGKKNKNPVNYILNVFYTHPRKFLSTLTVGNLMVLMAFVYCTIISSEKFIHDTITKNEFLILLIQFSFASLIIFVNGELLPRAIFKNNANLWIRIMAVPAFLFYVLLYPIAKIFTTVGHFMLRLFGVKFNPAEARVLGRVELDTYVKQGMSEMPEEGNVDSEVKIFKNALDFSSVKLRDCMVPRTEIVAVSKDTDIEELKDTFVQSGFSKIIVYADDIDNIIGYIHMWEMFSNPSDWNKNIASISYYPDSMLARNLMSELLLQHKSIAVVVDEFGGTSGVITMEDLVEEIFGDIEDEYDVDTNIAINVAENEYVISGRLEVDQLNEKFDFNLPQNDDYTTVAGFILHHIQRFPKMHESIKIDRFTFKILKVTSRKIEVIKLYVNQEENL